MIYRDYQKAVYDFLLLRRAVTPGFNFSVRQKASKNSELNYFIGTEKSQYFGFTFWDIPVAFPGSANDLINFIFWQKEGFRFRFQVLIPTNVEGRQNELDLVFCKSLLQALKATDLNVKTRTSENRILYFEIAPPGPFLGLTDTLEAFFNLWLNVADVIDHEINALKIEHPDWVAGRLTDKRFDDLQRKMSDRFNKHRNPIGSMAEETDNSEEELIIEPDFSDPGTQFPLNTILYGPPGTGKTYNTINRICELLGFESKLDDGTDADYRREMHEFVDKHLGEQVEFITFHQSLSYEDFIEGIKPQSNERGSLEYPIRPGVFTRIAYRALQNIYQHYNTAKGTRLDFAAVYGKFVDDIQAKSVNDAYVFTTMQGSRLRYNGMWKGDTTMEIFFEFNNNSKKTGPGTEPFRVRMEKIKSLYDAGVPKNVDSLKKTIAPIVKYNEPVYYAVYKSFLEFLEQRYPNLVLQDLPLSSEDSEEVEPELTDSRKYGKLLNQLKDLLNQDDILQLRADPFVLVIDEINRGNVSQIFGELITLLEDDKRFSRPEELTLSLTYSASDFCVPPNLYIVGTMNTADRSVEALDSALRRRFSFEEKMPDYEALQEKIIDGLSLEKLLRTINERITFLKDRDHQIGHSYLINVVDAEGLRSAFERNIMPLLQEYFYNDYSSIQLILGPDFVEEVMTAPVFAVTHRVHRPKSYRLKPLPADLIGSLQKAITGAIDTDNEL